MVTPFRQSASLECPVPSKMENNSKPKSDRKERKPCKFLPECRFFTHDSNVVKPCICVDAAPSHLCTFTLLCDSDFTSLANFPSQIEMLFSRGSFLDISALSSPFVFLLHLLSSLSHLLLISFMSDIMTHHAEVSHFGITAVSTYL